MHRKVNGVSWGVNAWGILLPFSSCLHWQSPSSKEGLAGSLCRQRRCLLTSTLSCSLILSHFLTLSQTVFFSSPHCWMRIIILPLFCLTVSRVSLFIQVKGYLKYLGILDQFDMWLYALYESRESKPCLFSAAVVLDSFIAFINNFGYQQRWTKDHQPSIFNKQGKGGEEWLLSPPFLSLFKRHA